MQEQKCLKYYRSVKKKKEIEDNPDFTHLFSSLYETCIIAAGQERWAELSAEFLFHI